MILALLMLGFRACAETFLQGHVQHEWHMQRAATSSSYESWNTSRGAKVQECVGFLKELASIKMVLQCNFHLSLLVLS